MNTFIRRSSFAASLAFSIASASFAQGTPNGALPPRVTLVDAWDRDHHFIAPAGLPTLVIYEDKDSGKQNDPLKQELAVLAKGDRYRERIRLVAVADVSSYDFWPARGFVKDAIKKESSKHATLIYCDWTGTFRTSLGLAAKVSNVRLYGRNGELLFSFAGAMPREKREELIARLKTELGA